MHYRNFWIKLSLICLSVKSILTQQQCIQLQQCMDLAMKAISEMQQPLNSGSYNSISVHGSAVQGSVQCRSLRTNFECLINFSPYCLRSDLTRNSAQYISTTKQLLDVHCDQGTSWSNTQCYRKQEITQNCETMLPELNIGNFNYFSASIPKHVCEKYQRFRHCVYNVVLTQCNALERELFFSYLFDKVQEISYKCANDTLFFDNYERYHPLTSPIYNGIVTSNLAQPPYYYGTNFYPSSGYNRGYDSRYTGYLGGSFNGYDRNRIGDPYNDVYINRFGNRYGSNYGYGLGYGLGYPNSANYDDTNCLEKARYAARPCEETFQERQKDARSQRTSVDVQRKLCCSIYYYRDCLAMTVRNFCRDNNLGVVDMLMGEERRRELMIGCREYSGYDYCNSSTDHLISFLLIGLIVLFQYFNNLRSII